MCELGLGRAVGAGGDCGEPGRAHPWQLPPRGSRLLPGRNPGPALLDLPFFQKQPETQIFRKENLFMKKKNV